MTNTLTLEHVSVSSIDNNCYLLCCGTHGFLIDAADDAPALLAMAKAAGVSIDAVLTTYRHFDHVRALKEVLATTGAHHYASREDAPALPAGVDTLLNHGDVIEFEGHHLDVIILRGHTEGGASLAVNIDGIINLFVGDSLFPGGVGKTTTKEEFGQLFQDVTERLFDVFDDSAVVWPGHGKPTTLGAERPHLHQWRKRGW